MKRSFQNRTCVITGAAGGIGRELALELARQGARLALSDVNSEQLAKTQSDARDLGAEVHATHLDVADHKSIYAYAEAIESHFGKVHQLYNNAGVSGSGALADMSEELIQRVIDINLLGVLHGSRAFLPRLVKSGEGTLINISSLNGFAGVPGLPVYCASKFGVRGLTEALRADALLHGDPVQIVCVHPGGIKTNIARANVGSLSELPPETRELRSRQLDFYENKLLTYPADKAARDILHGVARGKSRIVITRQAKTLDWITRLFPSGYLKILNKHMQGELFADT
jgi:NAD(P)-dependent dehydrogenase (short-subunit alcohol dehydrogenase family)